MTTEAELPERQAPGTPATPVEKKFEWARQALREAGTASGNDAASQGLAEPDGWRWRVLADLDGLRVDVARDYVRARDKQRSQHWESWMGPAFTGGGAGIGVVISAVGAGIVKFGGWGWLLVVLGFLVAVIGSVVSASTYVRSRHQKLRYLRLLHDFGDYAYLVLPSAKLADAFQQLDTFRQLWESAGT